MNILTISLVILTEVVINILIEVNTCDKCGKRDHWKPVSRSNRSLTSNLSSSGCGESSRGRDMPHRSTRATPKHIHTVDTTSEEEGNL